MTPHLLCFGMGYSARETAARLARQGWKISATSRTPEGRDLISALGYRCLSFPAPPAAFDGVSHLLSSAPPGSNGDPVIGAHHDDLCRHARQFAWAGYLSTTGVYGDAGGGWVDEDSPLHPGTERGRRRLLAERQWLDLHQGCGLPVHLFRLAGIYGPGRNQLESVLDGSARRVIKPGQVFSRIHVEDIAGVLEASMRKPSPGRAYNVCDDEPCPPQDVVAHAARLLGLPLPPEVPFESAELTPMARSFYADSKRVSNRRIKEELGYRLRFPDYRAGLAELAEQVRRRPRPEFPAGAAKTDDDRRS
jgi:nucleoside-diphosphate-sugar epimerase